MRKSSIKRSTTETKIELELNLDGVGQYEINTDCGFFKHMMELFTRHARIDLKLTCVGDSDVDFHHTVEDIGIVLGQAVSQALGDKRGIKRYGQWLLPMDEALVMVALDISGRGLLGYNVQLQTATVGNFDTELVKEFLIAFSRNAGITLHVHQMAGENTHHIIEAIFKGMARALAQAIEIDARFSNEIPSTKGMLDGGVK